jgi:hypothetical protein
LVEHLDSLEDSLAGVHVLEIGDVGLGFRHIETDVQFSIHDNRFVDFDLGEIFLDLLLGEGVAT